MYFSSWCQGVVDQEESRKQMKVKEKQKLYTCQRNTFWHVIDIVGKGMDGQIQNKNTNSALFNKSSSNLSIHIVEKKVDLAIAKPKR